MGKGWAPLPPFPTQGTRGTGPYVRRTQACLSLLVAAILSVTLAWKEPAPTLARMGRGSRQVQFFTPGQQSSLTDLEPGRPLSCSRISARQSPMRPGPRGMGVLGSPPSA